MGENVRNRYWNWYRANKKEGNQDRMEEKMLPG